MDQRYPPRPCFPQPLVRHTVSQSSLRSSASKNGLTTGQVRLFVFVFALVAFLSACTPYLLTRDAMLQLALSGSGPSANGSSPATAPDAWWRLPAPPLQALHPLSQDDNASAAFRAATDEPFSSPHVMYAYIRPSLNVPRAHDLFLLTAALRRRNLTATHCVLGGAHRVPVVSQVDEVVLCVLHSLPRERASLSVLLASDDALARSRAAPVELAPGLHVAARKDAFVAQRDGRVAIRSLAAFDSGHVDPLVPVAENATETGPRFGVCLATMTGPGSHMLPDFVDHHRRLGVDRVYVFDNGVDAATKRLLATRPDVERLTWPFAKAQTQAFSFALLATRPRCEYLLLVDVDEFVLLGAPRAAFAAGRRPLHDAMRRVRAAAADHLQIRQFVMANSGYVNRPRSGHVPELYTHAKKTQSLRRGKSVCLTARDWRAGRVHPCGVLAGGAAPRLHVAVPARLQGRFWPAGAGDAPLLVHFYQRSWEEWVEKWSAGRVSVLMDELDDARLKVHSMRAPDPDVVDVARRTDVVRYTFFRDFWRMVRDVARDRVHECVLVAYRDGRRVERVVRVA